MKTKFRLLIAALFSLGVTARAQDYHIAHFDVVTLYLNPASTGLSGNDNTDYQATFDQRSQWRSIGVKPFVTTYLAYDQPYKFRNRNFGIGGYLLNSNGGIGNINTFSFLPSISYDILAVQKAGKTQSNDLYKKHTLTVGLQLGLFYRSTNANALNYDVQYTTAEGGSFDKSIPNNEAYGGLNILRFDANYGIYYKLVDPRKKFHPYAGLAISHLTRPRESLTGADSRMPVKWAMNAGCDVKLNEKFDLNPRALYLLQSKASDITIGILMTYLLNEKGTKLITTLDCRIKDAVIIGLGLKTGKYTARLSYDVNTSYLKTFTNRRGGLELSLIYIGKKKGKISENVDNPNREL